MIHFKLLRDRSILIVSPDGPLEKADFEQLAKEVDHRSLAGKASEHLCYISSSSPVTIDR